jgi:hypothetical protein
MTEEWLIERGFSKIRVPRIESDNPYDYYYYDKFFCSDITFYTTDSIDVVDNNWEIKCWEIPILTIKSPEHYDDFCNIVRILIGDVYRETN